MPVTGRNCYILSKSGKYIDVSPFTLAYKALRAPVVDAAIQYDSPYNGKSYILVIWNALHVPSMTNNLLPPFMLREAGVEVNDHHTWQLNNLPIITKHTQQQKYMVKPFPL